MDFAAGSVETDLRLRATIFTNSVVPGINFTFELRPITGYGGGSGSQAFISTIGSAATGATLTTADDDTSDPFAIPTSGLYVVAATASGTIAAGSLAQAIVEIQARSVGS